MTFSNTDIHLTRLSRRRLLDILSGSDGRIDLEALSRDKNPLSEEAIHRLSAGDVAVLWQELGADDVRTPNLTFVVSDEDYLDFSAWCMTYVGTFFPFTAFFRVIRTSWIKRYDLLSARRALFPQDVLERLVGVCISEAVVQTSFRETALEKIPTQNCLLTFSYSALAGLMSGLHPAQILDLESLWSTVRRDISDRQLNIDPSRIASFWLLACSSLLGPSAAGGSESAWISSLRKLVFFATKDPQAIPQLEWEGYDEFRVVFRDFDAVASLPREKQLRALDIAYNKFRLADYPEPLVEAVLGYLLAKLSNGSFDYLSLTREYHARYPATALWFAFFSAWQDGFDGLSTGGSLGWRLATRIASEPNLLSRPSADIAADEFFMLSNSKRPRPVRTRSSSILEVELAPNVSGYFPNPARRIADESPRSTDVNYTRASRLIREALNLLEGPTSSPSEGPVQESLFSSADKKKSSKINKRRT